MELSAGVRDVLFPITPESTPESLNLRNGSLRTRMELRTASVDLSRWQILITYYLSTYALNWLINWFMYNFRELFRMM